MSSPAAPRVADVAAAAATLPDLVARGVAVDDEARRRRVVRALRYAGYVDGINVDDGDDIDAHKAVASTATRPAFVSEPPAKLTPLEAQIFDLKRRFPGTLLAVETGYRCVFYGVDAVWASRALTIYDHRRQDRFFRVASVPVHRTGIAARRLVEAGHRVGVIRQAETAAVKAAGLGLGKKSDLFQRELVGVYSPSTLLDDDIIGDGDNTNTEGQSASATAAARWVIAIASAPDGSIGWVAVSLVQLQLRYGLLTTAGAAKSTSPGAAAAIRGVLRWLEPVEIVTPQSSPPLLQRAQPAGSMSQEYDNRERFARSSDEAVVIVPESQEADGSASIVAEHSGCRHVTQPLAPGLAPDVQAAIAAWSGCSIATVAGQVAGPIVVEPSVSDRALAATAGAAHHPGVLESYAFAATDSASRKVSGAASAAPRTLSFFGFPMSAHAAQPITSGDELSSAVQRPRSEWGDREDIEAVKAGLGIASVHSADDSDENGQGGSSSDGSDRSDAGSADLRMARCVPFRGRGGAAGGRHRLSSDKNAGGTKRPRGDEPVADTAAVTAARGTVAIPERGARGDDEGVYDGGSDHARVRVESLPAVAFDDAVDVLRGGAAAEQITRCTPLWATTEWLERRGIDKSRGGGGAPSKPPVATGGILDRHMSESPVLTAWRAGFAHDAAEAAGAERCPAGTPREVTALQDGVMPAACRAALAGLAAFLAPYGRASMLLLCNATRCLVDAGGSVTTTNGADGASTLLLPATALFDLDVLASRSTGDVRGSLLGCLVGQCATTFGARLLRDWVAAPLADTVAICARLDAVTCIAEMIELDDNGGTSEAEPSMRDSAAANALRAVLRGCPDLELLLARVVSARATPVHVAQLSTHLMAAAAAVDRRADSGALSASAAGASPLANMLDAFPPGMLRQLAPVLCDNDTSLAKLQASPLACLRTDFLPASCAAALDTICAPGLRFPRNRDGAAKFSRDHTGAPSWRSVATQGGDAAFSVDGVFTPAAESILFPRLAALRADAAAAAATLHAELAKLRTALKMPRLEWTSLRTGPNATTTHLVELPRSAFESSMAPVRLPADFIEVSRTTKLARFRTPTVNAAVTSGEVTRDLIRAEATVAWRQWMTTMLGPFLRSFAPSAVAALAQFDAICALAATSRLPGWVRPTVLPRSRPAELTIVDGRHPAMDAARGRDGASARIRAALRVRHTNAGMSTIVTAAPPPTLTSGPVFVPLVTGGGNDGGDAVSHTRHDFDHRATTQFVPNSISIGGNAPSTVVLTGPNAGGKSTLVRMAASIAILAHIGSYVPASSVTVGVLDSILTRMGGMDDLPGDASTFAVECSQTSAVLATAATHPRALLLLDELGRGTSTFDGTALAAATLRYIATSLARSGTLSIFITHYPEVANLASDPAVRITSATTTAREPSLMSSPTVNQSGPQSVAPLAANAHMAYSLEGGELTLLYTVASGAADASFGLNVARSAGLPAHVVALAARKAAEMERANAVPAFT